jgi:hypothetical protein
LRIGSRGSRSGRTTAVKGRDGSYLRYQLARVGCGGLAALLFGKALDVSVEGGYGLGTYVAFYGGGALFGALTIWLSTIIHAQKEAKGTGQRTRPLTWGDLKQMRVPVEAESHAEGERAARRCARHIHAEMEASHRRINGAIRKGFWWNVNLEGLESSEWARGKDLLADNSPKTYDAVAPVYVLIDAMNVQASNHLQGGLDEFSEDTAKELRSLRSHVKTAQGALQKYYEAS